MKSFVCIHLTIFLLAALETDSQTYSNITYDSGTNIEVQSGADVCATSIIINGTFTGTGTFCNGPLPVELQFFTYSVNKNNVTLNWTTVFEINNSGFDIERKDGGDSWKKISFVLGNGTTIEPKVYFYEDKKLASATYKYRLKQTDYNGNYEYFNLNNDVLIGKPNEFSMSQNYPNPSNPVSKIDYEIPVIGKVTIKLYNILGEEALTIVNKFQEAGYYTAVFDGTGLASGVYFYRIIVDGNGQSFTKTLKMALVK